MSSATAIDTELKATGVAVLLAYWAQILPPKGSYPGIECHDMDFGWVAVRAYGYGTPEQARRALDEAATVCKDGGLVVATLGDLTPHSGFVVRRRLRFEEVV